MGNRDRSKSRSKAHKHSEEAAEMADSPSSSRTSSPSHSEKTQSDCAEKCTLHIDYPRLAAEVAKHLQDTVTASVQSDYPRLAAEVAKHLQDTVAASVQSALQAVKSDVATHAARLTEVEGRVQEVEKTAGSQAPRLSTAEVEIKRLWEKVEDLENRSRRNNLRVVGVPESVPPRDLHHLCETILPQLLGLRHRCRVERAHRLGPDLREAPERNRHPALEQRNRPRQVIVKYLDFTDKVELLRAFRRLRDGLHLDGHRLLLFGDFSAEVARRRVDITAVSGSDVTFTTDVSEHPSEIIWYINNDIIVELVNGKPPDILRWKDRVSADLQNGMFILRAVTPADSGRYRAESLVSGKISEEYFTLKVQDRVCPVVIRNTTVENNVTLRCICSVQDAPPSTYKWVNRSEEVVSTEEIITVQKTEEPQPYRCEASNQVSSSNFTVIVPGLKGPDTSLSPGAVAAIIIFLLILLVLLVLAVLYREYILDFLGRSRGNNDDGNQTTNQENLEEEELPMQDQETSNKGNGNQTTNQVHQEEKERLMKDQETSNKGNGNQTTNQVHPKEEERLMKDQETR